MSGVTGALALVLVAPAHAQYPWDVTAFAGVAAVRAPVNGNEAYREDWFHAGLGGLSVGRHLTRHAKIEVEATFSGTGTQFVQRYVEVPASRFPYPVGAEATTSLRAAGLTLTWQFFENEWVHPFVSAGAAVDSVRRSVRVWEQFYYAGDARVPGNQILIAPESREGPTTRTALAGVVAGGAKFYVRERMFVRTEGRATFNGERQHLGFRVGFGVDF